MIAKRSTMPASTETHEPVRTTSGIRGVIGGFLMGLANLVPGISGGTMLLAVGIYPPVIRGIAEVSTFRFRLQTLVLFGCIAVGAAAAILGLVDVVKDLVVERRWIMYSLFIGLTLGGVPVIWRMVRPLDAAVALGAIGGVVAMVALVLVDPERSAAASDGTVAAVVMLVVAGIAAGAAMILPGLSGGYLLLVLGQYFIVLSAVAGAKHAVGAGDWARLREAMWVFVPFGVGAVIGVVGVSHLVRMLLDRFEKATLGVLLGLLLGAVVGLWPYQRPVEPEIGQIVKGQVVTESNRASFEAQDWPTEHFRPAGGQVAGALGLIAAGFLVSTAVARLGSERR